MLSAGTTVHAGEPGLSGFFTSQEVASAIGNNAAALNQGLQIAPRAGMYRPGLTAFRLIQDVLVARSVARANPQFGPGGLEQYYISNWQDVTEPLVSRIMQDRINPVKIDPQSENPAEPYSNLLPIVESLLAAGNRALDGGFILNPDGWRCRLAQPLDFDLIRASFDLPLSIVISESHDSILDQNSWSSIEGPGAYK